MLLNFYKIIWCFIIRIYKKNHSTITLVERVSKALDNGKYVVDVFLDLGNCPPSASNYVENVCSYGVSSNYFILYAFLFSYKIFSFTDF